MDIIEKDYQHVLKTHINASGKQTFFRTEAFKFFKDVVHYEDVEETIEKLECRAMERTSKRTEQMLLKKAITKHMLLKRAITKQKMNVNTLDDKGLWKKQQQYNQ
eukprot:43655_1